MADDGRENVLRGLGVKRRRSASADDAEGDEAKPKKDSVAAGLGIKRRRRDDGGGDGAESGKKRDSLAAGLGIKRRSASAKAAEAEAEEEAAKPAIVDPLAKIRGKLGSDDTAVQLLNHFRTRPDLVDHIPERAWTLQRTHGRYMGDGREERAITVGWKPAMVLYTIPAYPDGPPKFTKDWKLIEPGLHEQPEFSEDGFKVDLHLNLIGDWYCYIVFKAEGEPLEFKPKEPEEDPRQKKRSTGSRAPSLGIKRRK